MFRCSKRSLLHPMVAALVVSALVSLPAQRLVAQPAPPTGPRETLFTILVFERPADLAKRTAPAESDGYWSAYDTFAGALATAGALRGGSALSERERAVVRGAGGADEGVAGARLGGYFVIAARNLSTARDLARQAPPFAVTVEVRPHRDNPHMMQRTP